METTIRIKIWVIIIIYDDHRHQDGSKTGYTCDKDSKYVEKVAKMEKGERKGEKTCRRGNGARLRGLENAIGNAARSPLIAGPIINRRGLIQK